MEYMRSHLVSSPREDLFNLCKKRLCRKQIETLRELIDSMTLDTARLWLGIEQDAVDIFQTRAGNNESFERIWKRFEKFATWFIQDCVPFNKQADRDDSFSRVFLGLLDLITKYSPEKYEGRFDLLARKRIKWAVLSGIRNNNNGKHGLVTNAVSLDCAEDGLALNEKLSDDDQSIATDKSSFEDLIRRLDPKVIEGLEYKTPHLIRLENAEELGVFEKAIAILCGRDYTVEAICEVLQCAPAEVKSAVDTALSKGYIICHSRQEQVVYLFKKGYKIKTIGEMLHISATAVKGALFLAQSKGKVIREKSQEPVFSQRQAEVMPFMEQGLNAKEIFVRLPQYSASQISSSMREIKRKLNSGKSVPHLGPIQRLVKDALDRGLTYEQILEEYPELSLSQLHTSAYAVRRKLSNEPIELTETEKFVVEKYLAGIPRSVITEELGEGWTPTKVSGVLSHARSKQPELRSLRPKVPVTLSNLEQQVLDKFREGTAPTEIAAQIQRKPDAVFAALARIKKKGFEMPKIMRLTEYQAKVAELAKNGYGRNRICRKLNCSKSSAAAAIVALRKKGIIPQRQTKPASLAGPNS